MNAMPASVSPDAFDAAVVEAVVRHLHEMRIVIVEGRRYPAHVERIGDTIKLLVDGHIYEIPIKRGLLP